MQGTLLVRLALTASLFFAISLYRKDLPYGSRDQGAVQSCCEIAPEASRVEPERNVNLTMFIQWTRAGLLTDINSEFGSNGSKIPMV